MSPQCSPSGNLSYRGCQQRTTVGRELNAPWSLSVLFSQSVRDGDRKCWSVRPKNAGRRMRSVYTFNEWSRLVLEKPDSGRLMTVTF